MCGLFGTQQEVDIKHIMSFRLSFLAFLKVSHRTQHAGGPACGQEAPLFPSAHSLGSQQALPTYTLSPLPHLAGQKTVTSALFAIQ